MKRNQKLMFEMLKHLESPLPESEFSKYEDEEMEVHGELLRSSGMIYEHQGRHSFASFFWKDPQWVLTNKGYDQLDLIRKKQREAGASHSNREQVDVSWQ